MNPFTLRVIERQRFRVVVHDHLHISPSTRVHLGIHDLHQVRLREIVLPTAERLSNCRLNLIDLCVNDKLQTNGNLVSEEEVEVLNGDHTRVIAIDSI